MSKLFDKLVDRRLRRVLSDSVKRRVVTLHLGGYSDSEIAEKLKLRIEDVEVVIKKHRGVIKNESVN